MAKTYPIPIHPTWKINDSSKLSTFDECPRKFFYKYRLGWSKLYPQVDLIHGSAMHCGMEELYKAKEETGSYENGLEQAFAAYVTCYTQDFYDVEDWEVNSPKNPTGAMKAFQAFCAAFDEDDHKLIGVELLGSMPIGLGRSIVGKLDIMVETSEGFLIKDHKTSKYSLTDIYIDEANMNNQFNTYNLLGLSHAMALGYHQEDFKGILINHFAFKENKARGLFVEVDRFIVRKSIPQLELFVDELNLKLDLIDWNDEILENDSIDREIMLAYPRQFGNCTKWFRRCEFYDMCRFHQNPLRLAKNVQPGFRIDFWDPTASNGQQKELTEVKSIK